MKRFAALLLVLIVSAASVTNAEGLSGESVPQMQTETEIADVSEYVLSAGSMTPAFLPNGVGSGAAVFADEENDPDTLFVERVLAAWSDFSEEIIDLTDLGLTIEKGAFLYGVVMNLYPRFFDVSPYFRYAYDGNMMLGIVPQYLCTKEQGEVRLEQYDAAIEKMVADSVPEADYQTMSETEIALALHDYLALHVRYSYKAVADPTADPDAYNAYGAVVNGSAVCQGYTLAYSELLACNNIVSTAVTSENAAHAWNAVMLENGTYHVDVTFDDPGCSWSPDGDDDVSGFARHDYFMLTDAGIIAEDTKNDRSDMVFSLALGEAASVSHPDRALWQDAYTMFYIGNGLWLRHKNMTYFDGVIEGLSPSATGLDLCSLADTKGQELYPNNSFPLYGFMARLDDTLYLNAFAGGAKSGEIVALDIGTFEETSVLTLQEGHIAEELEEKDGDIYYLDLWYDSAEGKVKYERKKLEILSEEPPVTAEDLTGDGVMDVLDAIALAKHLAGLSSITNDVLTAAGFVPAEVSVGDAVTICAG